MTVDLTQELSYWLALYRTPGIGSKNFSYLLEKYGTPATVFSNLNKFSGLSAKILDSLHKPDWEGVTRDLQWLEQQSNRCILTLADKDYPPLLKEITDPPPVLFIEGSLELLSLPQLGIVGSRNPSSNGKETAHQFSHSLSRSGLLINSGLAVGIDTAAHQGSLASNLPTIAVVGTGLDRVYPARNRDLAQKIRENGALVSEFPIGTPPLAQNFPRRNRIISGLSLGILVIEAATQSGSLITARLAAEQGREVFAIPGSIHNPLSKGCHRLIREGAKLVETAQDIMGELKSLVGFIAANQPYLDSSNNKDLQNIESEYKNVLNKLGYDPVPIDALVERCQLTVEELSSILLVLELQGFITALPGGCYIRCNRGDQL
ncbi:DNA-processing protein DprA [Candidatus Nitrosacidococcus sp. I8]|uniref:DNA-processing protein DprA n=1 Tax=Candidatus Nitrosacidococcus sp. I8 TaxID=2942908 RepID=UPI0022276245|nr:DNA-processing protein DprA [Candidatus Nitrosacidococcus sp. I8]CAH9019628.1 hypothetical protein NURINAE_01657 [Candidatus Nitrosacidococcus sp. I8]